MLAAMPLQIRIGGVRLLKTLANNLCLACSSLCRAKDLMIYLAHLERRSLFEAGTRDSKKLKTGRNSNGELCVTL